MVKRAVFVSVLLVIICCAQLFAQFTTATMLGVV